MSITINSSGAIVKTRKAKTPKTRKAKVSKASEKRVFPAYKEGWTTLDYVAAYHAANASVMLTTVDYTCH